MMVDRGPLLTSAIIFYLSIGAAIFQVLEEPNWKSAVHDYELKKTQILKDYPCLKKQDLEKILERKAQFTCTAIFVIWGGLVHLVIPPFVFMVTEGWSYIEGLYFSFVTISTIGFGDLVAGVDPNADYHVLYRYFVELWIYLGLAWLSLFINWKVSMFVEVHKALKKRRKRRKESLKDRHHHHKSKKVLPVATNTASNTPTKDFNIFNFLSKKQVGYNDLIKEIGTTNGRAVRRGSNHNKILSFDSSPRLKRSYTQGDMEMYSMNKRFLYDNPSILQAMGNRGLLHPLGEKEELELDIFENQLDKDERENGGRWNSKGYQALIFQNANITFIDEENLMEEEEEESKGEFSLDDNVESELESKEEEERNSESEGSFFTTDSSENSLSYEELVGEYVKVDNTDVRT
ncbi:UNVERIFIED_CONTAM: hypothetical protein FKN15_059782 [Acipenser sinensis]